MRLSLLCGAVALLSMAAPAHAEDFEQRARDLVGQHDQMIEFCEPCGDVVPGEPVVRQDKPFLTMRDGQLFVLVDGRSVDARRVYLRTEPGWFRNLAVLLGVPAPGASPSLHVESTGPSGELITASDAMPEIEPPVEVVTEPFIEPAAQTTPTAAVEPPSAPAPSITIIRIHTNRPSWVAVLALSLSGVATSGLFWLLIASRARRRRTTLPRAAFLK